MIYRLENVDIPSKPDGKYREWKSETRPKPIKQNKIKTIRVTSHRSGLRFIIYPEIKINDSWHRLILWDEDMYVIPVRISGTEVSTVTNRRIESAKRKLIEWLRKWKNDQNLKFEIEIKRSDATTKVKKNTEKDDQAELLAELKDAIKTGRTETAQDLLSRIDPRKVSMPLRVNLSTPKRSTSDLLHGSGM